jgi:hypothetical protein
MDDLDLVADLNAQDDDGQIHFTILPGPVAKNTAAGGCSCTNHVPAPRSITVNYGHSRSLENAPRAGRTTIYQGCR